MAWAAEILQGRYTLVVTNVPFLGSGKQGSGLREFAESRYGDAQRDIATVFLSRIFRLLGDGGTQAAVTPQNWLFLKAYRKLRERLLNNSSWNLVARLGPGAFETITGHVVSVALTIISEGRADRGWEMAGVDVSVQRGQRPIKAAEKGVLLRDGAGVAMSRQGEQLNNPDAVVLTECIGNVVRLGEHAHVYQGIGTADASRYILRHWEQAGIHSGWTKYQMAPDRVRHTGGCHSLLRWENGRGSLASSNRARVCGQPAWHRRGVAIAVTAGLPRCLYIGHPFDCTVGAMIPNNRSILPALAAMVMDRSFVPAVRRVDQALSVTESSFARIPFDLDQWKKIAADQYPNGLPEPYTNDPTQWIFHGDPCRTVAWNDETKRTDHGRPRTDASVLHVALARLLGYRWPAELDPDMRLAPEQRDVADDCRAFDEFADLPGIVCLSAARGKPNGADRLRAVLAHAYGDQWSTATERSLLEVTSPRPPNSLEHWLRDRFFQEHCKLFHNRPFIWHIWDGRKDGFHALVNYHRLAGPDGEGRRTLESLTFAYLNEWIERQRTDQGEGIPGADGRLAAALDLQQQLQRIRTGEPPCDIFVRWRPLHEQAIGWEPDINDGVRLNIRPFMRAQLSKGGLAGAGILRWKPNVSWKRDRGKEPEDPRSPGDFPWFWGCLGGGSEGQRTDFSAAPDADFDGNRWNDLHYTRGIKIAARQRAQTGSKP